MSLYGSGETTRISLHDGWLSCIRLLLLFPDHSPHAVKMIDLREAVVSSGKFQVMFDDCTLTVGCKRAVTSSGGRL